MKKNLVFAACCAAGASSAKVSEEVVEKMRLFGEYTGIAFQIKDDLFDYGTSEEIGKPTGIDIKEQKLTLPLIYTLNEVSFLYSFSSRGKGSIISTSNYFFS